MTRVFIASSTEGRPYAQAVAAVLARQGVHVVPLDAPVAPFFRNSFECREIGSLSELPQVNEARQEYLLLIDQQGAHYFAKAQVPTSQFFRKMVADISGELLWKWNDKFLLGDREETRSRIRELHRVFGSVG